MFIFSRCYECVLRPLAPKFKVHPSTLRAIAQLCNFLPLVCSERSSDYDNMAQPPPLCVDVLSKPLQLPSVFVVVFFFFSRLPPEPNAYRSMVGRAVNSTQLAQDYAKLRTLLQSVRYYQRAQLYGPNAGRPRKNAILLLDG